MGNEINKSLKTQQKKEKEKEQTMSLSSRGSSLSCSSEEVFQSLRETSSNTLFDGIISLAKDSSSDTVPAIDLHLGGVGLRKRLIFSVYAFGLYFDPIAAKPELERWNTYDLEDLVTNLSFYKALISSKFTKATRMVLLRNVKGNDFKAAFEESLGPKVQKYAKEFSHGHNQASKT